MAQKLLTELFAKKENQTYDALLHAKLIMDSNGVTAEQHMTNGAIHLSTDQINLIVGAIQSNAKGAANGVAPLGADGKVPAQYISVDLAAGVITVADYSVLLALTATAAPVNKIVLVEDATGDSTVDSGWAMYIRTGTAGTAADWFKLTEQEGLDIDFSNFLTAEQIGAVNGVAPLDGGLKVPTANLPSGSISAAGILQLSDSANSTDTDKAATPNAVKTAYDMAISAKSTATTALAESGLRDFAIVNDESEIAALNLRDGAIVGIFADIIEP